MEKNNEINIYIPRGVLDGAMEECRGSSRRSLYIVHAYLQLGT
jgi:hypothetical protein